MRLMIEIAAAALLVFCISAGLWPSDKDLVLSCCVEKVALALEQWMLGTGSAAG